MRSQHASIIFILVLYLALASMYSALIPLGEGPDEPGHAKYVFFLAREGRLPVQCPPPCVGEVPGEGHQPPLAYALMLPALLWMPREERSFDLPGNRYFVWANGQEVNAAGHGSRELWPWHGEVLAWHLARLINVLIGAVTILFTYLTAHHLTAKLRLGGQVAFIAAILVAFNPQFLFISSLINNDGLLAALSAMLLWTLIREPGEQGARGAGEQANRGAGEQGETQDTRHKTQDREWSVEKQYNDQISKGHSTFNIQHSTFLGVVLGLALLTKQSALLLVPIVLLASVLVFEDGKLQLRKAILRALTSLLVAGFVAGWWYWRNWQLYGDLLGVSVFLAEFRTQPFDPGSLAAWRDALFLLHESFWARFGWMNLPVPRPVIWFYSLIELPALFGLIRFLLAWRYRLSTIGFRLSAIGFRLSAIIVALPILNVAWMLSFALSAGLVAWQGRLLFPALPAIAVLLGLGLGQLGEAARSSRMLSASLAFALIGVAAWLPFGVIRPAYPPQTLTESVALSRIAQPYDTRFADHRAEPGAELRSVRIESQARAGSELKVTLLWHALGRQNRDWWVFIHLVDAQGNIVAEANGEPRQGAFRMSLWSKGDWIEDQYTLVLPANVVPGTYRLRLGLWDANTQERSGVFNTKNKLIGDSLEIGTVEVKQ